MRVPKYRHIPLVASLCLMLSGCGFVTSPVLYTTVGASKLTVKTVDTTIDQGGKVADTTGKYAKKAAISSSQVVGKAAKSSSQAMVKAAKASGQKINQVAKEVGKDLSTWFEPVEKTTPVSNLKPGPKR